MQHHHTPIDIDIKPTIDFPCKWNYRIIGFNKEDVLKAINNVLGEKAEISSNEHTSSQGKYVAINCSALVQTDEERLTYFNNLVQQDGIIMVI